MVDYRPMVENIDPVAIDIRVSPKSFFEAPSYSINISRWIAFPRRHDLLIPVSEV